jgi:hypothetical protein
MGVSPRFQLLSRPRCHLCGEMEELLREVLPEWGLHFTVHDVDSDPEWRSRFGEVVPVLLRDGKPVAKIRLDRRQLRRIVERKRLRM